MIEVILIILVYAVVMLIGQKIDRAIEEDRNKIDIDEMFRELWGRKMTEKILRDGVNVAGCCLYCGGNCMQRMVDKNSIDNDVTCNGICDYGALYRKEYIIKPLERERDELKQENERLKECKDGAQLIIDGYIELTGEYKSALEEIRELAKNGNAIDGIRLKIIDKINEVLNESK